MKLKKRKIKYSAIFLLCWFAFLVFLVDGVLKFQTLVDYFGIVSGNDVPDKVAKAGFTITPSPNVDAPIINEYKLTLECKVVTFDEDENGGARVVGEIVNMSADESILDEEGNIDLGKLQPVIFDSAKNEYRVVGEKVGTAWGSGKTIQEREVK